MWENLPVKLPFSSSLFPLFVQRAFGLTADAVRTFPVEHLRFLFRPASIWSHSGRSVRKSPGQAPIFLFPVSSFCPANIWSRSGRSENFPGRALTFSLSSSEHLVSQRTQCEKISQSSSHFPLSRFLFCPASIGLTAEKEGANSPDRSLQITTAPRCRPAGPVSPGTVSRHHGPPGQTSRPFLEIPARQTRHSFGGSLVRRLSSALSLLGGVLWVRAELWARSPPPGQHAKHALNFTPSNYM